MDYALDSLRIFFFEIFSILILTRKEVLSFRNPNNIHYLNLNLLGIHRKKGGGLLRIFDQLRYLETKFLDYFFI